MHTLAQIKFANNVDILATEGTGEQVAYTSTQSHDHCSTQNTK